MSIDLAELWLPSIEHKSHSGKGIRVRLPSSPECDVVGNGGFVTHLLVLDSSPLDQSEPADEDFFQKEAEPYVDGSVNISADLIEKFHQAIDFRPEVTHLIANAFDFVETGFNRDTNSVPLLEFVKSFIEKSIQSTHQFFFETHPSSRCEWTWFGFVCTLPRPIRGPR